MIRLSLRQFRSQAWVALGLLLLVAILLGSTGPHLAKLYADYHRAQVACTRTCLQANIKIGQVDRLLELMGTVLVALPGLVGAFWGAPLVSRELEQGTHRLVWTQSISRTRWLAAKLTIAGAASVLATGLLSLMVTWWSVPGDKFDHNRFNAGLFGERNIAPLGYAAFAFVLGVTAGILIRRTLPAMATTLAGFLAVRLAFTYLVRQHLLPAVHHTVPLDVAVQGFGQTNGGPPTLFAGANIPDAWVYSSKIVDSSGHGITSEAVAASCPGLTSGFGPPPVGGNIKAVPTPGAAGKDAFQACVTKLSSTYHGYVSYQPASRYWIFQALETGIFLAAALALAALCFYWIGRRV